MTCARSGSGSYSGLLSHRLWQGCQHTARAAEDILSTQGHLSRPPLCSMKSLCQAPTCLRTVPDGQADVFLQEEEPMLTAGPV